MTSTPIRRLAVVAFAVIAGAAIAPPGFGAVALARGGPQPHLTAMDVQGTWVGEFRSEVNPAFVSSVELRIDAVGLRRFHWIALVDGIPMAEGMGTLAAGGPGNAVEGSIDGFGPDLHVEAHGLIEPDTVQGLVAHFDYRATRHMFCDSIPPPDPDAPPPDGDRIPPPCNDRGTVNLVHPEPR